LQSLLKKYVVVLTTNVFFVGCAAVQEVDVKAGGGHPITIGEMSVQLLTKLDWYSTLFPRVPVPIQKTIEANLAAHMAARPASHRGNDRNEGTRGGRDTEEEDG